MMSTNKNLLAANALNASSVSRRFRQGTAVTHGGGFRALHQQVSVLHNASSSNGEAPIRFAQKVRLLAICAALTMAATPSAQQTPTGSGLAPRLVASAPSLAMEGARDTSRRDALAQPELPAVRLPESLAAPRASRDSGASVKPPSADLRASGGPRKLRTYPDGSVESIGTGDLVKPLPATTAPTDTGAPISLSIENGDIREVVRNIIGDLLGENYIIDPRVQGTITIRTARPIPRADVLPLLETVLRTANAALVQDGAYFRVLPATDAVRGIARPVGPAEMGQAEARGHLVAMYSARYVGAKELMRLLEPFAKDPASALRIDELRNIVFLSGPRVEVNRLLDVAAMFDVDLLEGMSFALVPVKGSDVKTMVADLERVQNAAGNPFTGLLRVVPLERMNSLLLVSPQAKILQEAKQWIERLDAGGADAGNGQKLFVYALQYTQAEKLQPILQAALQGRSGTTSTIPGANVAPGQTPSTLAAPVSPIPGQSIAAPGNSFGSSAATNAVAPRAATGAPASAGAVGRGDALARNAVIVADKDRNSLLIVATQSEYHAIEAVIKKLDVAPKQVAIEVQIAEVSLTGEFSFGLQSYFAGKLNSEANRLTINNGLGKIVDGAFSYTWKYGDALQAFLKASESSNRIRTLSRPNLITMENQKASFSAGTQISVRTQSSATSGTVTTTDSYQYINTGININVTPRVSGQNVFLEIQQEISDAGVAAEGNPNPPITKRSATTSVMVASGDTMIMGGLFQEGGRSSNAGLPLVSSIPLVGGLFGGQKWQSDRTELALLITPRILESADDTRAAVDEFRRGLANIDRTEWAASTTVTPTSSKDKMRLREALGDKSLKVDQGTPQTRPTQGSQ